MRVILFVRLAKGLELDDILEDEVLIRIIALTIPIWCRPKPEAFGVSGFCHKPAERQLQDIGITAVVVLLPDDQGLVGLLPIRRPPHSPVSWT